MHMTKKQRMLTAMTGGTPDRVPASPDINWMIPAKLKGGKFWDVYYYNKPPIWKAYNDAVRYFGIDGFSHHGYYSIPHREGCSSKSEIILKNDDRLVIRDTFICPAGEMTSETIFLHNEPPTSSKKWIDDFASQFEALRYLSFGDVSKIDFSEYKKMQADMGDDGVVGMCMLLPTLLTQLREPVEAAFYDFYDENELLDRYIAEWTEYLVEIAHEIIRQDVKPDFVFFPNSGMVTMQSEEIMKRYSLPALKKLTKIFKEAGIVTSLHSCGKERAIVEAAALETDLDCIDPLEIAPMGDCDLAELKSKFGDKIALKGNLHTIEVMYRMNADQVEAEARKCLEIGMPGGGFILATGDQCGRDTPEENIFRLVEVCEKYGRY